MGFIDRLISKPTYLGITGAELGSDFEEVVRRLCAELQAHEPIMNDMGLVTMCRSPVLVIKDGAVQQPAAVVPKPILSRFWAEPGSEYFEDPNLAPLVAGYARALAGNDKLARAALQDTESIWVSADAPAVKWPDQDKRLRLASLVLADVIRKLAADFSPSEIKGSYGFSEDAVAAAHERTAAMQAEERDWFMAAL